MFEMEYYLDLELIKIISFLNKKCANHLDQFSLFSIYNQCNRYKWRKESLKKANIEFMNTNQWCIINQMSFRIWHRGQIFKKIDNSIPKDFKNIWKKINLLYFAQNLLFFWHQKNKKKASFYQDGHNFFIPFFFALTLSIN